MAKVLSREATRASQPLLLTVEEAAGRLGINVHFVRRLIAEKRIAYVKLGPGRRSPVRIREDVLDAFIAAHTIESV